MQYDLRGPNTQKMISALAKDFFREAEKRLLQAELGRPFASTKFTINEYAQLLHGYPYNTTDVYRAHSFFYMYALTIDYIISKLAALYNIVRNLDNIGSESVYTSLKAQLPHPDYVPWAFVESPKFENFPDAARHALGLRNWPTGTDLYFFDLPLPSALIAITQGLYIENVYLSMPGKEDVWCNKMTRAVMDEHDIDVQSPCVAVKFRHNPSRSVEEYLKTQIDTVDLSTVGNRTTLFTSFQNNANLQVELYGGPVRNAVPETYIQLNTVYPQIGTMCQRLSESLVRTKGVEVLFATYNDLMREFHRVITHTMVDVSLKGERFLDNLSHGPLLGSTISCPPGSIPRLVDRNGKELTYEQSVMKLGDKHYVSGNVDVKRSGCMTEFRIG